MTPEGKVKAEIKAHLVALGAYVFMPVQTGMGASTLDMLVCINGKFLAIECKRAEGGRTSPRQKFTIGEVQKAGGIAVVARSWLDIEPAVLQLLHSEK